MSKHYSPVDLQNRVKVINSPNGSSASDLATFGQLQTAIEGLKNKDPVVVASQANIVIATALNNGDTVDGVALVTGDRVLVKSQTASEENGIYIVGVTPVRSDDASTATELNNILVGVTGGTDIGTVQRQTATVVTLGTDPVVFVNFGIDATVQATETVAGKAELATQAETNTGTDDTRIVTPLKLATNLGTKFSNGTIGDGATQNPIYNHNLGTRDVEVEARLNASPYSKVDVDWEATDTNNVTFMVTGTPLTSAELAVHVSKI